ncbi:cyclin-like protein [Pyronema omphalodes]|nr:cyclin-like protein [Pyronema omphalodes]
MEAKTRPTRSTRVRHDENHVVLKTKNSNITVKGDKAVGGLKVAPARRQAFADVSNKVGPAKAANKESGKNVVVQEKETRGLGLKQPAQRISISKNAVAKPAVNKAAIATQTAHTQAAAARRVTRRTTVYEDSKPAVVPAKRADPKKAVPGPKVSRDAVTKREVPRPAAVRNQAPIRPIARVKQQIIKGDEPVYSDQQPHLFDKDYPAYEEDNAVEDEDDEEVSEDEQDPIIEAKARFNNDVEPVSEDEANSDDDETNYTAVRRAGDNTTGIVPVLVPRWTTKSKKEIQKLNEEFGGLHDEDEEADISMVAEYGDEIFEYMRELERKLLPNAHYMDFQSEIQWSMRAILMDWLVQVHTRFNLLPETMFLCQNYIDRFLSAKVVSFGKLQLVGATALFVAAKYEEINCPSVHEIVYMVDNGYTAEEILKAERFMLSMLNFELGWPGPMSFLRRVSKADDYDLETRTLAKYFLEITIMDERFVGSPPSFLAAGAHCLARHMLQKGEWTPAHTFYSGYTASQLEPLVHTLVECCENPKVHHHAVFQKFADKRYKRASLYVANWMAKDNVSAEA